MRKTLRLLAVSLLLLLAAMWVATCLGAALWFPDLE